MREDALGFEVRELLELSCGVVRGKPGRSRRGARGWDCLLAGYRLAAAASMAACYCCDSMARSPLGAPS